MSLSKYIDIVFKQYILLGVFSLMLVACSNDNHELIQYIQQIKQRELRAIEPIPGFRMLPDFKFSNDKKQRDPFKPTDDLGSMSSFVPMLILGKQKLKSYSLNRLKFVGILIQGERCWGLIAVSNERLVPVQVGDYIGQNGDRILEIKNTSITLEDTIKGGVRSGKKRRTTLKLYMGNQE